MEQQDEIIKEIIKKNPNNTWLKIKLSELETEISEINRDRNRLVLDLSKARTEINRLRAGLR